MTDFFRFPHTPHLAWLGQGAPRDDKVLTPAEARALLTDAVVVEEKLDGANLGFHSRPMAPCAHKTAVNTWSNRMPASSRACPPGWRSMTKLCVPCLHPI